MTRLRRALAGLMLDVVALAGLVLVAYGFAQMPAPWGPILAPIVLGLGLLAAVRLGAR